MENGEKSQQFTREKTIGHQSHDDPNVGIVTQRPFSKS